MRTLLRILLSLLLLLVLFGLLAVVFGPFLVSTNPAPGVADASSVAASESRFVQLPTGHNDTQTFHYIARSGPDLQAPQRQELLQQDQPPPETRSTLAETETEAAPAFVLLHGFTFNLFTWNQVLATFERYGPVVAYDQLPYGLSAKPMPDREAG